MRSLNYILILFAAASCSDSLEKSNMNYENALLSQMQTESEIKQNELENAFHERLKEEIFATYVDTSLLTKINTVKNAYLNAQADPYNMVLIDSFEHKTLYILVDHPGNKKYSLKLLPYNVDNAHPSDTAHLNFIHRNMIRLRYEKLNGSTRRALLKISYMHFLDQYLARNSPPYFNCFFRLERCIYSTQNVYFKDEPAFAVVSPAVFDNNHLEKVRVNGKEFVGPIQMHAPAQKGVHEINGEIGVREKGELRWIPFSHRILVK